MLRCVQAVARNCVRSGFFFYSILQMDQVYGKMQVGCFCLSSLLRDSLISLLSPKNPFFSIII